MEQRKGCGPDLEAQEDFLEEAVFSLGSVVLPTKFPEVVLGCGQSCFLHVWRWGTHHLREERTVSVCRQLTCPLTLVLRHWL